MHRVCRKLADGTSRSPDDGRAQMTDEKIESTEFYAELEKLLNRYSQENHSDTPDFILTAFIRGCLESFNSATRRRDDWYKRDQKRESL
jgi:hypothetical protein